MQPITTKCLLPHPLALADATGLFELDTDPAVPRYRRAYGLGGTTAGDGAR